MHQKKHGTAILVMRILFTIFVAASIAFIFVNSSEIGSLSALRSQRVTQFLNELTSSLGFGAPFTETLVRKLGHFAEYCLLGFWLMLTLRVYTRRLLAFVAWPLLGGLVVAVLDEFYQTLVPGRSGQVQDVVIDFGGVVAGLCVALFIQLLAGAIIAALRRPRAQA